MPQAEILVQYKGATLWTASKMERDPERYLLPFDDGDNLVTDADDLGLLIPVQSEWGPITLTIDLDGTTASPADSTQTWEGQATCLDDTIWAESFDQIPDELDELLRPRGGGTYDVKVDGPTFHGRALTTMTLIWSPLERKLWSGFGSRRTRQPVAAH